MKLVPYQATWYRGLDINFARNIIVINEYGPIVIPMYFIDAY